jgi:hypothetical protein
VHQERDFHSPAIDKLFGPRAQRRIQPKTQKANLRTNFIDSRWDVGSGKAQTQQYNTLGASNKL